MRIAALAFRFCVVFCLVALSVAPQVAAIEKQSAQAAPTSFMVSEVAVNRKQFNPSRGEAVTITYVTSQPAKTVVKIFDPEMQLVRDLMSETRGTAETTQVVWDGKDAQGRLVPDEAYFFTIEASDHQGRMAFYDPTTSSGGQTVAAEAVRFDSEKKLVLYSIPEDSRVSIRAGIAGGGPLLKSMLYGVPRAAGAHEEAWDGKDESGKFDVTLMKGYQLAFEATSLFENSMIARGNTEYDFFRYRRDLAAERPRKVERPPSGRELVWLGLPRPEPIRMIPEPKFRIELPKTESQTATGLPVVGGKLPIKIYLDESIKKYITEQRFEIIFFVDFHFVTEKEEGYSPFTLIWDSLGTPNGEHDITINVATFSGQVSSGTARVMIRNEP
jgi:hypothetical protein